MTRSDAMEECYNGARIGHCKFSTDEYVYCDKMHRLIDECGYEMPWDEFWELRSGIDYEEDWFLK
jgi:hypothetical protein